MRTTALACLAMLAGGTISVAQIAPAKQAGDWASRYDGHRAVRVTVSTPRELMTVLGLTDDVLTCEGSGIGTFDVRMTPGQFEAFTKAAIPHEVLIPDLGSHLSAWRTMNDAAKVGAGDGPGWYDAFRDLAEVHARLDSLVAAHPTLATSSVIGQSVEGRPIRLVRITGPGSTATRPAIVINGTQHSRESLTPMTTVYFMEQLLSRYGTDPRITAIVNGVDFHFIPVLNPDGYNHVWTTDPMWRKNRRAGSPCMGVDLNRNWDFAWGNNNGSSPNTCDETYRGPSAASEPETQTISAMIDTLGGQGRLAAHIDVHSYATKFLSAWGCYSYAPPDIHRMAFLGTLMRNAISTSRGTVYEVGQGSLILYIVSGGSKDYSYGRYGADAWTIELPGTSFHPPPAEILPVARETELGFLALAEHFLPQPATGACCVIGGCIVANQTECTAAGGVYNGDGTACAAAACPTFLKTGASNAGLTAAGGGIFLNLTATTQDLGVPRIDYYANSTAGTAASVQVWVYPGSYVGRDSNSSGWVLHDTVTGFTSNGTGATATLNLATPIQVPAGQTRGVYLVAQAGGIRYTNSGAYQTWADANLSLFSARARSAPWAGTANTRTFAGTVYYTLPALSCYANCDGSTAAPVLNVQDFSCFLNAFAAGDSYANCDGSTAAPVLNVQDFSCFLNAFAAGCS